ncbi:MAG TPA: IS110 family transposase, partial [Ktedonobacterales bacterium]|nr:IS110 family transposase [Ktedonobacterales bacterium]
MELVYERCCGLDVHKKLVVACLIALDGQGQRSKEIHTFRTTTQELLLLRDWLVLAGCTHLAMEATGVYWKPIYHLLDGAVELLVVNARHIKAVPGRKTDVRDAEWIADLLQHGLLRASFIPPAAQRELRELTRYRTSLVQERARAVNRLQKTLEDTNLKLGDVVSDIMGQSARAILAALLAGETDPVVLADLARGRLKAKRAELEAALVGTLKPHHRFLLTEQLVLIDTLEEAIRRVSQEIEARMGLLAPPPNGQDQGEEAGPQGEKAEPEHPAPSPLPWAEAVRVLDGIPGINPRAAQGILAEIGTDMTRFPSARHLASWAGMCPGNHESAGKRLSGKTRKGSPWLRQLLVEAAQAAAHTKNTYLSALYRRIAARRGAKVAMIAVGHAILVMIYHMLSRQVSYTELGGNYFDERDRQATQRRLVRRLEQLGFQVS